MPFTPPDIVICLILGFFTFNGFRHGFIEEMARIISLVGGFIFASKYYTLVIPYIQPYIEKGTVQVTVAYLGVFIASVIVIAIIAKICTHCCFGAYLFTTKPQCMEENYTIKT